MGGCSCRNKAKLTDLKNGWALISDAPALDPNRLASSLCNNLRISPLQADDGV